VEGDVPEGFELLSRSSPLTQPWEPIYCRRSPGLFTLGLRAASPHLNSRGFAHGGLIAALADNAMGYACAEALGGEAHAGLVTTNLSLDYVAPAQCGHWVVFKGEILKLGSLLCVAQAVVEADGVICARANATYRLIGTARGP
jgi:uncharacterized protein (TIGR00369 family)